MRRHGKSHYLRGGAVNATTAALALALILPLGTTATAVSVLRKGSDRALVLPTPLMLWLVFTSQQVSVALWPMVFAHGAVWGMLYACWRRRRQVAQWAAIACGGAVAWLQMSGLSQH